MGSVITRDVHLQEGTFSFLQGSGVKPSKTAKQYPLPKDFVAQTKVLYSLCYKLNFD